MDYKLFGHSIQTCLDFEITTQILVKQQILKRIDDLLQYIPNHIIRVRFDQIIDLLEVAL